MKVIVKDLLQVLMNDDFDKSDCEVDLLKSYWHSNFENLDSRNKEGDLVILMTDKYSKGCNCGIVHDGVEAKMGFFEQMYEVVEYEKGIGDKKLNNEIRERKLVDNASRNEIQ
ncbi:hypothetical protein F8M41_012959 [Gigaspora margarita]|uniref:Uncharacterized protein n=1 Tax=Gigaspora margarita TaxID=4874 RepID=A0A8H4EPE2_GIGMA|nr:hypothetical protein F8M41_012959 [Gigaspora margarita]